jgi:hypothetical protein
MCEVAPNIQSLTSLEQLPPNTGRSCTSITFNPALAAVIAPQVPVNPPPTITRSAANATVFGSLLCVDSEIIILSGLLCHGLPACLRWHLFKVNVSSGGYKTGRFDHRDMDLLIKTTDRYRDLPALAGIEVR